MQFFPTLFLLLCTLSSSGFRFAGVFLVRMCYIQVNVVRSFRLNSCENKFKQIVHRLYTFGFLNHYTNEKNDTLRNRSIFSAFLFILLKFIRAQQFET